MEYDRPPMVYKLMNNYCETLNYNYESDDNMRFERRRLSLEPSNISTGLTLIEEAKVPKPDVYLAFTSTQNFLIG